MNNLVVGIVAHVDAGKTSLTEAMLYNAGEVRRLGRVDHGDTFLDSNATERRRGITIYSKQTGLTWADTNVQFIDTPGHIDFSGETERAFAVIDAAVLVISALDGVQPHTRTLWNLLQRYNVPTIVFINKMDAADVSHSDFLDLLSAKLGNGFLDFQATRDGAFMEAAASLNEEALDEYLANGAVSEPTLGVMVMSRDCFPCYFGSALRNEGVTDLLDGIASYAHQPNWQSEFGALVHKITHDEHGERLTWLKITGGELHAKDLVVWSLSDISPSDTEDTQPICVPSASEAVNGWHPGADNYLVSQFGRTNSTAATRASVSAWEQKVQQVRVYKGTNFTQINAAGAGTLCAVTGLEHTFPGQGLGVQAGAPAPVLQPVLSYRVTALECDSRKLLETLRILESEDPCLAVSFDPETSQISLQLMGAIQREILQDALSERFNINAEFDQGHVIYRETITSPVNGFGHFEPLRHFAETELLIEPLPIGSGIVVGSTCSVDNLDLNWQRLVVTHLLEREHPGVLTGSPLTDVRVTLVAGRAHDKHTNGGDFRQATYRAVRQGLMRARAANAAQLLEPWLRFRLEIPEECIGRAIMDMQRMGGSCEAPFTQGDVAVLEGRVPASELGDYALDVSAYSHGAGSLTCIMDGYAPCHNTDEVIAARAYDPEADTANPPGSVYCVHGAGHDVPWDELPPAGH